MAISQTRTVSNLCHFYRNQTLHFLPRSTLLLIKLANQSDATDSTNYILMGKQHKLKPIHK